MNHTSAVAILVLLLFGPLAIAKIEHNIELYFLALGVLATMLGSGFTRELISEALHEPVAISVAVMVAALLFGWMRRMLDRVFNRLRKRVSRPVLTAATIFAIASISSVITAIVAALVLVEVIGLLHFARDKRVRDGCGMLRHRPGRIADAAGRAALDACHGSAQSGLLRAVPFAGALGISRRVCEFDSRRRVCPR